MSHTRSRTRVLVRAVLVAFSLALFVSAVHAVPAAELSNRARNAAGREDWNAAARSLEELVAAGIDSSDVLFNLGTIYAHAGRHGEAIWRFEQVAGRSPFALDARHNLRVTRLALAHRDAARTGRAVVEAALPLRTWLGELLPLDWALAAALALELGALAAFFAWRRKNAGEIARVAGAVAMVVFTLGAVAAGSVVFARALSSEAGIVLHDGLRLLRAPAADAIPDATIREGERVELLAREGTFVRVRTVTGELGWVQGQHVGAL